MTDKLNLALPPKAPPKTGLSRGVWFLLILLLAVGVANLLLALRPAAPTAAPAPAQPLSPKALKSLALKLEKQSLTRSAADAWAQYLHSAALERSDRAKIWYRIGKLHQEAGEHEKALYAYYRSEKLARVKDLRPEISRRAQECLEAMGKFSALRYELSDRVGVGASGKRAGDDVLAEVGGQKITKAQLDHAIENAIDLQLAQFAARLPADARKRRKEALLKRLSNNRERLRFLNQLVVEEVLYRKAREDRLADDPTTRRFLRDTERKILAQKEIERAVRENVKITETDLKDRYEAHKREFVQPERVRISRILVKDKKTAEEAMKKLAGKADFAELAQKLSLDDATKAKGGEIDAWVAKDGYISGMDCSAEDLRTILATDAGKIAPKLIETKRGVNIVKVRERQAERQKTFDEVREQVYRQLRAAKEREAQQKLIGDLRERYRVVIHTSRLAGETPSKADGPSRKNATKP